MAFAKIGASAKGGKDFDPAPAGVWYAICTQVIHLGKQEEKYEGKKTTKDKVYIRFEIPDESVTYEKNGLSITAPVVIGQTFTLSIGDKSNLGPFIEGWRGRAFTPEEREEFNIASIIGKPCQLSVVHEKGKNDGKVRAKISGAFALIKEQKDRITADPSRAKSQGELIVYTPDAHDPAIYEKLPNWVKEKLSQAVQPKDSYDQSSDAPGKEDYNDDIPF